MDSSGTGMTYARGVVGAVIGAAVGYFATYLILQQGYFAPVVPPAALGFGAGLLARRRLVPLGILCAIAGLAFGLFVEWKLLPFAADPSLTYFIAHLHELKRLDLLLIAIGAFVSYRLATGFAREPANNGGPSALS